MPFRTEHDYLGKVNVPSFAYYGAQTARARENFQISGIRAKDEFTKALAVIKKTAAYVNYKLGTLDHKRANAIIEAADEVISGKFDREFILDVFQAGAGTPFNMNMNEVIANRANEILGGRLGKYDLVHPNDHVNMSQSTNDVMPTAIRIACLLMIDSFFRELSLLQKAFERKAIEFKGVVKLGRTHLMDALPVTLGQEFNAYSNALKKDYERFVFVNEELKEIGIGGTAVGTGANTHPRYAGMMVDGLSKLLKIKLKPMDDAFMFNSNMDVFVSTSSTLRLLASDLIKICNDLRLLNSGPNGGISEIVLPAVEPGSSIMPGKVNPSIAEAMTMVCHQVIGNDAVILEAAKDGQLELNIFTPVIMHNLLFSIEILTNGMKMFRERCVAGIKANKARAEMLAEESSSLATVLNPYIGYERAAEIAKESLRTGKRVKDITITKGILTKEEADKLFSIKNLTGPSVFDKSLKERVGKRLKIIG